MARFIALPLVTMARPPGSPPSEEAMRIVSIALFVILLLNCLVEEPLFGRSCGSAENSADRT